MGDTAPPQAPAGGLGGASGAGLLGGGSVTPRVHSAIVERLRARIAVCRQHHLSCEGRYERGRAESSDRERESTMQLLSLVQHGQGARKANKHAKATATTATTTAPAPPPAAPSVASQAAATAPPPPPDYHHHHQQHRLTSNDNGGINREQQPPASTPGDQRNSALLALQGSLKRKQIINLSPANSKRPNGFVNNSFLDIKRIRVGENLSTGQGTLPVNNGQSHMMPGPLTMSQAPLRKTNAVPPPGHSPSNAMFNMGLKEVKKEPGETVSCSKHANDQMTQESQFGDDPGEQLMDPELQELFNELTNISVPPMSDLELENMINATIKQDDPFSIDLGQQSQRSTPRPSLPMEKMIIKSEYSPGLTQGTSGSPQLRPPSAGPTFSLANSALSTSSPIPTIPQSQPQPQTAAGTNRALPSWQEVSHAQQLKQIAANRQQHARMQQQQQQQTPPSWPALPSSAGPSPGTFVQENIPSSSFGQQPFNPQGSSMPGVASSSNQSKAVTNYAYKASPSAQAGHLDVLLQQKTQDLSRSFINNPHSTLEPRHGNTKPLFHFNSDQANQQMPSLLPSQSKPSLLHYTQQQPQQPQQQQQQQQQQGSLAAQQQQQPPQSSLVAQQQQQQQQQQHQQQGSMAAQQPQPQPQQQPQPPSQPTQPLSSQSLLRSPLPLQQKIMLQKMQPQPIAGLGYQVAQQHRQDQHTVVGQNTGPSPSPNSCSNPNTASGFMNSQQSLLNQQMMGKKQTLHRPAMEPKQQLLLQQQMLADSEKLSPQDQMNRHLTRPPPDYKDQRRNSGSLQPATQYSGGASTVNINSNQTLTNPVSTHTLLTPNSSLMSSTSHGMRMPLLSTAVQSMGVYGNLPCTQPGTYNVTPAMNQLTQQRNTTPLITNQNNPLMPRPSPLGANNGNSVATFAAGTVGSSQQLRPSLPHSLAGMPAQRSSTVMITSNTTATNWASQDVTAKQQEALKSTGVRFPTGGTPAAYTPNQSLQAGVGNQPFSQRAVAPPSQLTPAVQMRPMNQMNQALNGQTLGPLRGLNLRPNQLSSQSLPNMNPSGTGLNQARTGTSQPPSLTPNTFPSSNQSSRAFQGTDHSSDLAFDFLSQQTDNMGPALNSDADFIDSLLKTEPGNDDWMKDINLDEILGSNS